MAKNQIPEVSVKSTKAAILEALDIAKGIIADKEKAILNPEAELKAKKDTAVVNKAEQSLEVSLKDSIALFNGKIVAAFEGVVSQIDGLGEEYNNLKEAIQVKKNELQELFDIEAKATTLAALINAHTETKATFDKELMDIRATIVDERKAWKEEKDADAKAINESRKKAEDEWAYNFKRKQQQDLDKLSDDMASKKKLADEKIELAKKALDEREEELNDREEELDKKEEEVQELRNKVANIPNEIAAAAEKATKEANSAQAAKYNYEKQILEGTHKGDMKALEMRNEALTKDNERLTTLATDLQKKLDDAYGRIQELAGKTIEGAANAKMISSYENTIKDLSSSQKTSGK